MAFTRLPINTLSGGVGRQAPTKRLISEAENLDNCLVSLEKSVEKRPPMTQVAYSKEGVPQGSYLPLNYVDPPLNFFESGATNFNADNLYFHYLDIDGFNRYCIIINRAAYPFDPVAVKSFTYTPQGSPPITINLNTFISVFRIEPTEWVQESVDILAGVDGNTSGFNRGIFEYITFGNKNILSNYRIANQSYSVPPTSIKDTFGSIDLDVGLLLWNKLIPLDYLPDNGILEPTIDSNWVASQATNEYIHSGDAVNYKIAIRPTNPNPVYEDAINELSLYWSNVRDDIEFYVSTETQEEEERGQSMNDFSVIPQYPATEVQSDVQDANGYKAQRMLAQYYDNPRILPIPGGSIDFNKDHYHQTSPLPKVDRDGQTSYYGFGKVYYARNPYLTFPPSFYRATRYGKNPYFERIRTEEAKSVFDHRRFPIIIYKDTATDGKWRVKHMPLLPRRAGTVLSNPGPKALERKEKVQSVAFWKNRLWIATDSTLLASRTNSFYNFWIDDVQNIVETDPIDIQSTIGAYNKLSYIVPFQTIMFVASSGSVQFEIRGGSIDTGISAFNVELRPTSFYSTSKLVEPQKMGNNIFFMDSSRLYMYLSGSAFNDEFSTSMDMSTHCKGYLPTNFGAITTNSATNSIMFVDADDTNNIYFFTFRTNGEKVIQNAYYRWILSNNDNILSLKAYEKDLYTVSKRYSGTTNVNKLVVYYSSLETVSASTPMLDWLTLLPVQAATYSVVNQSTTFLLPHYDPEVNYIILGPAWGTQAYTAIKINPNSVNTITDGGIVKTQVIVTGNYTAQPVYVGHSYLMNIELSQQVQRSSDDPATVYEGVLNIKKATFRHYNSGSYDVIVNRRGRIDEKVTFYPTDINSLLSRNDQLKIDSVGEHLVKILSYSEACKIYIQSAYPTPCNISNIELACNFRRLNTSIE